VFSELSFQCVADLVSDVARIRRLIGPGVTDASDRL
jgi:hypothetical protein